MPKNDSSIDQQIQARVEQFTADLSELIREAALEAVREALGADPQATGSRAGTGRTTKQRGSKKRAAKKRTTKKRATKARGAKRGGRPRRQSDARVTELSAGVVGALQAQPQQSISDLATELGVSSADLKRPIADLLEAKQIKKKGQRRGTRYSAA